MKRSKEKRFNFQRQVINCPKYDKLVTMHLKLQQKMAILLKHLYRDEGLKKGLQKLEQPRPTQAERCWVQLILDASSNGENLLKKSFCFSTFPTSIREAESTILAARSKSSFWLSTKGTEHSDDDKTEV